jgi:hypothetical protein
MKWYKNPLKVFTLGLFVFALGAIAYNWRLPVWGLIASVSLGGGLGYFLLQKLHSRGHQLSNIIVTLLIALLLLNPALTFDWVSLAWTFLGGVLVVLAKLGPKYKGQIIFNPAAFGLIILSTLLLLVYGSDALLPTFISWWGTDYFGSWPLVILIPLILYGALKFRKLYLLFAFLGFNALWILTTAGFEGLVYPFTSGMLYFLAGVMILEPKTSPIHKYWQIAAALVAVITYRYIGYIGFMDVELWAIIAVNGVHLLSRLPIVKSARKLTIKNEKS